MSPAALGARVKARRGELGLSQRDLPGIDSGLLSRIETGKVLDPSLDTVRKLASGLGLSVEELATGKASAVRQIELRELQPDPLNPRQVREDDATDAAFIESIRTQGLIQPLAVRLVTLERSFPEVMGRKDTRPEQQVWRVIDGHRRHAALVHIHGPKSKTLVPCRVIEADDTQTLLLQLVANVQRADMNPWDLARAIADLVGQKMDTQAIADALGRKRRWVQEMASVGRGLHNGAQNALLTGRISISQAIAIAAEKDEKAQNELVMRSCDGKLNEDEIRAITADRKEKLAEEKEARERSQQIDIEDFTADQKAEKYPVPNEHGVFTSKPTVTARWTHKRGFFEIELFQYGDDKWCAGYRIEWRLSAGGHGGLAGGGTRTSHRGQTAAVSFLDAAAALYSRLIPDAEEWPEDVPAFRQLYDWILVQARRLAAKESLIGEFTRRCAPPAKPSAKKAPPSEPIPPAPQDKKRTLEELKQAPEWARSMMNHPFVVVGGKSGAVLAHGWAQMMTQYVCLISEGEDQDDADDLFDRMLWNDAPDGRPFAFCEQVYCCLETYGPA